MLSAVTVAPPSRGSWFSFGSTAATIRPRVGVAVRPGCSVYCDCDCVGTSARGTALAVDATSGGGALKAGTARRHQLTGSGHEAASMR